MAAVAELARMPLPPVPEALAADEAAGIAWYTYVTLQARRTTAIGARQFTAAIRGSARGHTWTGDLAEHIRIVHGPATSDHLVAQVRKFLDATGNMHSSGRGRRAEHWLPDTWADVSPDTARRLALEEQAAEDADRQAWLRLAPPEPEPGPGTVPFPPDQLGVIGRDQFSEICRWCPKVAHLGKPGALTELRDHERTAHPGEYWAGATHVCPVGTPQCRFAAPDAAMFAGHLVAVHRAASKAYQDAMTGQARDLAASLRPAPDRPVPVPAAVAVPAAPAPAPPAPLPAVAVAPRPVPGPPAPPAARPAPAAGRVSAEQASAAAAVLSRYLAQDNAERSELARARARLAAATARYEAAEDALKAAGRDYRMSAAS